MDKVDLLGYTISSQGISPQQTKVAPIQQLSIPINRTEVRSFLGITGYYRQCIKDYAKLSRPLQNLTSPKIQFEWTPDHTESFEQLKIELTSDIIINFPNLSKPYKLYTDACNYAIGAILIQTYENGLE